MPAGPVSEEVAISITWEGKKSSGCLFWQGVCACARGVGWTWTVVAVAMPGRAGQCIVGVRQAGTER